MIQYTVFNTATGAILRTGTAMTEASARLQGSAPGTSVTLIGSDPATQTIDPAPTGGEPPALTRQPMKVGATLTAVNKTTVTADGSDLIVISNIPVGTAYDVYLPANLGLVQPADGIVNDGVLQLSTTVPGIYSVKLSFQNFLDFKVTFNAN